MIDGVHHIPLKRIKDDRGEVMHYFRSDSPYFQSFGEAYFSKVYPGVVKAWKRHLKMTQHLTVPVGEVKFVLYDLRNESPTYKKLQEVTLSPETHSLLIIPPKIWYGFKCLSEETGVVANNTTMLHDPDEVERLDLDNDLISFDWKN